MTKLICEDTGGSPTVLIPDIYNKVVTIKDVKKLKISSFPIIRLPLTLSADMFESVNKKTVVHPFCKVGFSVVKGLPEEARLL